MKFAPYSTSGGNYQTSETVKKAVITKISFAQVNEEHSVIQEIELMRIYPDVGSQVVQQACQFTASWLPVQAP